ncbi:hypothetical protein K8T06_09795 [bacterium]|nr:hypothetical protein [bacterium]
MSDDRFKIPGVKAFPMKGQKAGKIVIPKWLPFIVVAFILSTVLFNMVFVYVNPGEVALKEVRIGVKRGIQSHIYGPGLLFRKPFGMEQIHKFPSTMLVFETTNYPDISSRANRGHYKADKAAYI